MAQVQPRNPASTHRSKLRRNISSDRDIRDLENRLDLDKLSKKKRKPMRVNFKSPSTIKIIMDQIFGE